MQIKITSRLKRALRTALRRGKERKEAQATGHAPVHFASSVSLPTPARHGERRPREAGKASVARGFLGSPSPDRSGGEYPFYDLARKGRRLVT